MLALFPDAAFSALLYKFALISYFVIFLNLIPLLELDGYWILDGPDPGAEPATALLGVLPTRPVAQSFGRAPG